MGERILHDTRPPPTASAVSWDIRWEASLELADHRCLADLLARAFSTTRFPDGRIWAGARPELRVIGRVDGRPAAHAGVIRRFLRSPDAGASTLVGDVGLVAVHPGQQGRRLGVALMTTVAEVLARLRVPYGFLTCGPELRPFYERCGWTALTDRPLHSIGIDHDVEEDRRNGMLLPVLSPVDDWPPGPIHRDGQEI